MEMEIESDDKSTINDKYIILEKKGKGACGIVYLAEDKNSKKKYAIKVLKQINSSFTQEIEILAKLSKLNNKYIINLIEYGEGPIKIGADIAKKQFIVLDYASKGELFDYIFCTKKGLKEKYAKLIFGKIIRGVQAIHNAGICHRDLKMQNILVDELFNPKICDFGFATELKGKHGNGKLYEFLGTENYAAPEIFLHIPYDGIKVDVFSLGVILFNIVTCKVGFLKATRKDSFYKYIISKKLNKYWKEVEKIIGVIPEGVKTLFIKMVSFDPEERPTLDEILKDPWMKEIEELNEEQYKNIEKEVYEEFLKLEAKLQGKNETINTNGKNEKNYEANKDISDNDIETNYFNLDLPIKFKKTGLNMKNYIKITGNLNPHQFMNSLANKIKSEFENCEINEDKNKLKFDVTFKEMEENEEENEEENKNDEIEKVIDEQMKKLCVEDKDVFEDELKKKDNVIQIKLFESLNGGYIVRFNKKDGEIEDYNQNLDSIIQIVKQLL